VNITITEKQRLVIVAALDAYSRLQMGQLWAVAEVVQGCKNRSGETLPEYWDIRHKHTDPLTEALFDYTGNASHGIFSQHVPETAKIAYDLQCFLMGEKNVLPAP
jgi:hypothetical protein